MEKELLKPMITYSKVKPIIFLILIIINIIIIKIKYKNSYTKPLSIKYLYLLKINDLERKYKNNKVTKRKLYQSLNRVIKDYINEIYKINLNNYTLEDIKTLNNNNLLNLIETNYKYSYSNNPNGNIENIINKTKEFIKNEN